MVLFICLSQINERFQDKKIFPATYVINLKQHTNRLQHMDKQLNDLNIPYTKIEAIDAKDPDDSNTQNIIDTWPCLGRRERIGTKGIQLSNLKVFEHALLNLNGSDYILMLEDDCVLPTEFKELVFKSIEKYTTSSVIVFDDRCYMKVNHYPKYGMSAVLIKRDILEFLIKEMNPETSDFMNNYKSYNRNFDTKIPGKCYHDVLFFNLLYNNDIKVSCVPVVPSNIFKSSINPDNSLWWHKDS